jgi:hypothetical protein
MLALSAASWAESYRSIFDDLGRGIGIAAKTRQKGWSTLISLPHSLFLSEPKDGLQCAVGFCHPAVFDEFARIDLDIGNGPVWVPLKQKIILLLEHHALPFLEGFGKIVCGYVDEDCVIFRSDFWKEIDSHGGSPF